MLNAAFSAGKHERRYANYPLDKPSVGATVDVLMRPVHAAPPSTQGDWIWALGTVLVVFSPNRIGFVAAVSSQAINHVRADGRVAMTDVPVTTSGYWLGVLERAEGPDGDWNVDKLVRFAPAELLTDAELAAVHESYTLTTASELVGLPIDSERKGGVVAGLDALIARQPDAAKPLYLRALWLKHDKRWPEAERDLRRAVAIEPGHVRARDALAHVLTAAGKLDEALALAKELALESPAHAYRLGLVHEERAEWEAALAAYADCLRQEQTDSRRRLMCEFSRGYCCMKLERWSEAVEAFTRSSDYDKRTAVWMGQCLIELGRFGEATNWLRASASPEAAALVLEAERRRAIASRPRRA